MGSSARDDDGPSHQSREGYGGSQPVPQACRTGRPARTWRRPRQSNRPRTGMTPAPGHITSISRARARAPAGGGGQRHLIGCVVHFRMTGRTAAAVPEANQSAATTPTVKMSTPAAAKERLESIDGPCPLRVRNVLRTSTTGSAALAPRSRIGRWPSSHPIAALTTSRPGETLSSAKKALPPPVHWRRAYPAGLDANENGQCFSDPRRFMIRLKGSADGDIGTRDEVKRPVPHRAASSLLRGP